MVAVFILGTFDEKGDCGGKSRETQPTIHEKLLRENKF
jgi:hypothetical protein